MNLSELPSWLQTLLESESLAGLINLASHPSTMLAMLVVFAAIAFAMVAISKRRGGVSRSDYDAREDDFFASPPITDEQVELMHYLQTAFPDHAVLFRQPLSRFLAVRKSRSRVGVQRLLADSTVDFLVCSAQGRPQFAFEIDAFRNNENASAKRTIAIKNHMLKSAGVRLVRLKGSIVHWPPPEELRTRMLPVQRPVAVDDFGSTVQQVSAFNDSNYVQTRFSPTHQSEPEMAGLTVEEVTPWSLVKNRS